MSPNSGHLPVLDIRDARLDYGARRLWENLTLALQPGELVAVLGPNGVGKTSLLRAVQGLTPLSAGTIRVAGKAARPGNPAVGYIPQQKPLAADFPVCGRDLVALGLTGHKWGIGMPWKTRARRTRVDEALASVDASAFADRPVGALSGGEQQRIRVAQALVSHPQILLCDEPLLSLDPGQQQRLMELLREQCTQRNMAILLVTHEINPVLPYTDRILYLTDSGHRCGTVDEVMTSKSLSELYGSPITVAEVGGQLITVGTEVLR